MGSLSERIAAFLGYGWGYGIKEFEGHTVHIIDDTPTCITALHGNFAQGFIIRRNAQRVPCYVAKVDGYFAHDITAHLAFEAAQAKAIENMPPEERVQKVYDDHPDPTERIANTTLFALHNALTGSCEFGRREFAQSHGIDIDNGSMTMWEFCRLTADSYGGATIKMLMDKYRLKQP